MSNWKKNIWKNADEDNCVYCIIDGHWASRRSIFYGQLLISPDISWAHMYQGDTATANPQMMPFIVALKRGHCLTRHIIEEGWGKSWGIFFTASTVKANLLYPDSPSISDKRFLPSNEEQLKLSNLLEGAEDPVWKMRRHFRRFSNVFLEPLNKLVYFRAWDPWAAITYMLSSGAKERESFVGPVRCFITEDTGYYHQCAEASYYCIFNENYFFRMNFEDKKYIEGTKYIRKNEERYGYICQPFQRFYPIVSRQKFEKFNQSIAMSANYGAYVFLKKYMMQHGVSDKSFDLAEICQTASKIAASYRLTSVAARVKFILCTIIYGRGFEWRDQILRTGIAASDGTSLAMEQRLNELLEGIGK